MSQFRRLIFAALAFSVVATALFARDRTLFFRTPAFHFVQVIDENARIDWTGGYVFAEARVRLPRIIYDRKHPDFGKAGTETSITDARAAARNKATELATLRLMNTLTSLRLDSSFTLYEKMTVDRELRESLGNLSERFLTKSRNVGEGYVSVELAMPFLGEDGLYSMLVGSHYGSELPPVVEPLDVVDAVSGLVVDLREAREFTPSLEPRIFTDRGRLIYGPEMAGSSCIRRGLVSYYASAERAMQDARLGDAPYYTYAAGVMGRGKSDIYLDAEDAERLLGHASGRMVLRRCRVVFIVDQK